MSSGSCSRSGNPSGGTGNTRSPRWSAARLVTRTFSRGRRQELGDPRRGFQHLLEVVQNEQQVPRFRSSPRRSERGLSPSSLSPSVRAMVGSPARDPG